MYNGNTSLMQNEDILSVCNVPVTLVYPEESITAQKFAICVRIVKDH